ncbi:MAG: DUF5916 domain-containing protein, partial [Pseudomonadota bacterium]|nr:DUF5916 domain-containing protein [Pseudomonadota bacterium]
MRPSFVFAIFAAHLAGFAASTAHAVQIDGRIDPQEWTGAQHITDFRQTQPLSRLPASQPTEAWILATEEGLAIGFRNTQPASIPRMRQQPQRDQGGAADRVNVYVDFDGDGRMGYNLVVLLSGSIVDTTITNESRFSNDWDGDWRSATSEDGDTWSAEILLPWHIAPMQKAQGDTRTIAISLDRVIGATGERMSWPAISFTEQRFLSVLEKIQVPVFSQSLLAVTPYVVGLHDAVGRRSEFDAGGDVFWKPNGQFQLSATINPDFGQVESDQLVVNFGAIESFFSDRRPFFTENQSFFDVPFGSLGGVNRLMYTRRVGGPTDDGSGSGDVTAAVKVNGSAGAINYGVFAATEADGIGRDFFAVRATRDFASQGIGAMMTRVDRPFLDREATVYEFDHRWVPTPKWNVRSTVVASDVDQAGINVRDSGGQVQVDYDAGNGWRQQLFALHLGSELQLNDFGFLERNNFNYARYELARRITDLPATSRYSSHNWRYAVSRRANDHGVHIADAWAVSRSSERRDGGNQLVEVAGWTSGRDDLITRGNGVVRVPAKLFVYAERFRPRKGQWEWFGNARYAADGLGGTRKGAISVSLRPTFHVSDSLTLFSDVEVRHNPDWLLWRGGNLLGTFRSDALFLNAGLA